MEPRRFAGRKWALAAARGAIFNALPPGSRCRRGASREPVRRPDFLLRLPPEAILPQLPTVAGGDTGAIAMAYRRASIWLRDADQSTKRAYLATALLQDGAVNMFRKLWERELPSLWMPVWSRWMPVRALPCHRPQWERDHCARDGSFGRWQTRRARWAR